MIGSSSVQVVGSQARILYSDQRGRVSIALAINQAIGKGSITVKLNTHTIILHLRIILILTALCISIHPFELFTVFHVTTWVKNKAISWLKT